jgi:hypothetical protein
LNTPPRFFERNHSALFGSFDATVDRRNRGIVFLIQDRSRVLEIELLRLCHTFTLSRITRKHNRSLYFVFVACPTSQNTKRSILTVSSGRK